MLRYYSIQVTSPDTAWVSGRAELKDKAVFELPLAAIGDNRFSVHVFDNYGREVKTGAGHIVITRTLASIGAIPASHSIGVEVIDRLGGAPVLDFIINEGDSLPKRGSRIFKAGQTLRAGSHESINIKLWEGGIQSPITDNRFIGVMKIAGTDIESGSIPTGADIECEYEMSDSGTINLEVSIPCIGASFSNKNFYSRQEGLLDLNDVDSIAEQGRRLIERIMDMQRSIEDDRLDIARKKARAAANIDSSKNSTAEDVQKAYNDMLEARKLVSISRQENLRLMRQLELDSCLRFFGTDVRKYASAEEISAYENLSRTAQRSIERNEADFDNILDTLRVQNTIILLRQDWYIIKRFKYAVSASSRYIDKNKFEDLKRLGERAIADDNIGRLKQILFALWDNMIYDSSEENMYEKANVVRG